MLLRSWLLIRVPVVVVLAALLVMYARPDWAGWAVAVSFFGQAIQLWCFASLRKNKELTTRGPYALVRNPMYLGRYFVILGFILLFANPWLIAAYTMIYCGYLRFRVAQEEHVLRKRFGAEFDQYCARVHRFLPRLKPYAGHPVLYFNEQLFIKNHGGWNTLALAAFYAAVAVRIYYAGRVY